MQTWQQVWGIAAVVLFVVVMGQSSKRTPSREAINHDWAENLRWAVEKGYHRDGYSGLSRAPVVARYVRPEESGTYAGMSDQRILDEIHGRYATRHRESRPQEFHCNGARRTENGCAETH
jgi:hypothetical protein